jgi:dihydrofolate synthase/folylpolyglutamate synthase
VKRHTYQSAERFILSREFFGMKLGLENITEFLSGMGDPQKRYRTVHISGTNGKGSTGAMLAAVLQECGYRVGLFTSPHLVHFRERVRVNGEDIPRRAVTSYIDRYRKTLVKKNSRSLRRSRPWRWTTSPGQV